VDFEFVHNSLSEPMAAWCGKAQYEEAPMPAIQGKEERIVVQKRGSEKLSSVLKKGMTRAKRTIASPAVYMGCGSKDNSTFSDNFHART